MITVQKLNVEYTIEEKDLNMWLKKGFKQVVHKPRPKKDEKKPFANARDNAQNQE